MRKRKKEGFAIKIGRRRRGNSPDRSNFLYRPFQLQGRQGVKRRKGGKGYLC